MSKGVLSRSKVNREAQQGDQASWVTETLGAGDSEPPGNSKVAVGSLVKDKRPGWRLSRMKRTLVGLAGVSFTSQVSVNSLVSLFPYW